MNYIYNMLFSGIYGIVLEQQHEITLNYTALRLPYSQLLTASGDTRYLKPWFGGRPSMENSWRTGMLAVVVLQNKFLLIDQFALTFTVVSQLRFDITLPILQYFLTLLYQLFQYAYFLTLTKSSSAAIPNTRSRWIRNLETNCGVMGQWFGHVITYLEASVRFWAINMNKG